MLENLQLTILVGFFFFIVSFCFEIEKLYMFQKLKDWVSDDPS